MSASNAIRAAFLFAVVLMPVVMSQREPFTAADLQSASHVFHDLEPCISNHSGPLVIIVKNSIQNREQRRAIRETWAGESISRYGLKTIFVVGYSSDPILMSSIVDEETEYGDLVMGNFQDDYYNLTLKTVFTLSWVQHHHPNKWLLYVDDDVIVNLRNLYQFVRQATEKEGEEQEEEEEGEEAEVRIYCYSLENSLVIRDTRNKWYVSQSAYPNARYPDYCTGLATLMPSAAVSRLLRSCLHQGTQPKLWIDDAFVTGIAASAANVSIVSSPAFDPAVAESSCPQPDFARLIAAGQWQPQDMRDMWSNVKSHNLFIRLKSFLACHSASRMRGVLLILIAFNAFAICVLIVIMWRWHMRYSHPSKMW